MFSVHLAAASFLLAQAVAPPPRTEFSDTFRRIGAEIRRDYYAVDKRKDFVDDMIDRYQPRAEAAKSREEFSRVVNDMIDKFEDSHFDFFTETDQSYYLMDHFLQGGKAVMPNIGIWFGKEVKTNGFTGHEVAMVMDGSEAHRKGIRKGDIVISEIDGRPFRPVSSLKDRETIGVRVGRPGDKALMVTRSLTLPIEEQSVPEMFLEAMRNSVRVIPSGNHKIGYVRVWTMVGPRFLEELASSLRGPLKDVDGLIVDLRDGFGGSPRGYAQLLGAKWPDSLAGRVPQLFSKQMVTLINGGTRSAKEMVSYALKDSKRAFLIGQRTAGAVLGAKPVRVADWAILEIPAVEVPIDNTRLEDVGVTPHLEVTDKSDEKSDAILDRAVKHMRERLDSEKAA